MRQIAKLNEKDRKALFHNTAAKMGMTDANYLKKGDNMKEKIIRVITEKNVNGVLFQIAKSQYEFGTHYVLVMNGEPGCHSTDLERVEKYLASIVQHSR